MHSHKTLALLALAASTASPALSAPVLEGQQQARASVAAAEEAASGIGGILKTIGTGLGFGALPVVLQNVLGGNSTRRDTPHIIVDGLPVPFGGVIPNDTIMAPSTLPGIANKIPAPPVTTPVPTPIADGLPIGINGISPRAGIGSAFNGLLDSVSTSGSIGKVLSDGVLSGVASAAGAVGAGELFNLTRRDGEPHALVRNGVPSQLTAKDLISAFNVVVRRLAELD
ncbi:hypothetical protein EDB92DRAFT_1828798 [Lactarius akahatsu]|uniref:Uncharacterized protein n=1 Tax=Lactarius akahatsu TaxID=416441 RepID=A0AAD4QID1_9AGAM|nr:hypothetical protein EDB92DRAFT_1828798 [Lactarius akahatsu]